MFISRPKFSSPDMLRQVTGVPAELEINDLDEEMLYFSAKTDTFNREMLGRFVRRPEVVEFGQLNETRSAIVVGGYSFREGGKYFFRFPAKDFFVHNQDARVHARFSKSVYSPTIKELSRLVDNEGIFGGKLFFETRSNAVAANHGALVARYGEPSLVRFSGQIINADDSKEAKAQKLLDFVTNEIEYDHVEAADTAETLKRPSEVILSRRSDCSGKAILYASLLEQAHVDYWLVYGGSHITVVVEGKFSGSNGLSWVIRGKRYFVAEPTVPGFRIGESYIENFPKAKFIQKPSEGVIYNAETGGVAKWAK